MLYHLAGATIQLVANLVNYNCRSIEDGNYGKFSLGFKEQLLSYGNYGRQKQILNFIIIY